MGSCISPIIASIYVKHIEHTAITTFHIPPSLWLRYVDDTCCILKKDHINDFHTHLNSICSHIQFTIGKEHKFSLPFLDVLVKRNSRNGSITTHSLLSTTIYRQPMRTNRYLHYTSHHPVHQKLTVAKTLFSRVNTHITGTDNTQKHSELQNIRSTLRLNGFPTRTTFLTSRQPCSQNTQYNHFTSIPYIQGTSEKIRRVLNEAGVKVAMKPIHTIGRILPSPKDPLTLEEKSCLVYQVPCFDCDFVYIGQTKRDHRHVLPSTSWPLEIKNQRNQLYVNILYNLII